MSDGDSLPKFSVEPGVMMEIYFSDHFGIAPSVVDDYGALNINLVSDLPLFIDPFLLFNSEDAEYQAFHEGILRYLRFLRDNADQDLDEALIAAWYRFKEVKQNWLGFTFLGNEGHALGPAFARSLHSSLSTVLSNFGEEEITRSSHLEKLCLIRGGVGRDGISDFCTNLIKDFLCRYTEAFAREHLRPEQCEQVQVPRAYFNYDTESWATKTYYLPVKDEDFILLTPVNLLTRDDTWISHSDMLRRFSLLPNAIEDDQLRASINQYFRQHLKRNPTQKDREAAAAKTIERFPQLIDYYIRHQEDEGDRAAAISVERVADTRRVLVEQLQRLLVDLESKTSFYDRPWTSFDECRARVLDFKDYVEHQDGYRLINRAGQPFSQEKEVQLYFGIMWCRSEFDVNREPNNGRGPVDFKVSIGSGDKSLIEFKLASNSQLKRNLEKQVPIYEAANRTSKSLKVIICYTAADQRRVAKILAQLHLEGDDRIVLIDARSDNKPSASKA